VTEDEKPNPKPERPDVAPSFKEIHEDLRDTKPRTTS